jgi:hypothetical protein
MMVTIRLHATTGRGGGGGGGGPPRAPAGRRPPPPPPPPPPPRDRERSVRRSARLQLRPPAHGACV